jgi:hypothetical protein
MLKTDFGLRPVLASALAASMLIFTPAAPAADHRDAPAVDAVIEGDINDVYAFRDPKRPDRLVLAMNVNPFAVAGVRHSYRFSTEFLYQFKIDTTGDYREDFVVQVRFIDTPEGQMVQQAHGVPVAGYIGAFNRSIMDANGGGVNLQGPLNRVLGNPEETIVWAGQADDPFTVDVSQFFKIALDGSAQVFRNLPNTPLGPLAGRQVRGDGLSGIDTFAGFNSSFIVMGFPLSFVRPASGNIINIWGTVSVPVDNTGSFVQFERMGQPLFNTVFVPSALKDAFNASTPDEDVRKYSNLVPDTLTTTDTDGRGNTISGRATLLTNLGLTQLPAGVPLLLPASLANTDKDLLRKALLPDVIRLSVTLEPNDLGVGQFGLTNGRRYGDDVVDIALRLLRQLADVNFPSSLNVPGSGPARPAALTFPDGRIFAVLQGTDFLKPDSQLGDLSTSGNDAQFAEEFPYLAPAFPRP